MSHPEMAADNQVTNQRLLLLGRSGLFSDCLSHVFVERGFLLAFHTVTKPISELAPEPKLAIFCVGRSELNLQDVIRKRTAELRRVAPGLAVMMVFEEADRAALAELPQGCVAAVVAGIPSIDVVVSAVQTVLQDRQNAAINRQFFDPSPSEIQPPGSPSTMLDDLSDSQFTARETAVIECLLRGSPNKVIAHDLHLSESTVKVHLRSIMDKLKVRNRTQIVCTLADRSPSPSPSRIRVFERAELGAVDEGCVAADGGRLTKEAEGSRRSRQHAGQD